MIGQILAVAVLAVVMGPGVRASEPVTEVVASYLEIQAALAGDTLDGVEPAARRIGGHAAKMGPSGAAIEKAAAAMVKAPDVTAARAAFGPLSDAVIEAVKADPKDHDLKLVYCSMANASWLQKEDQIRNPYYGSAMLTCGEFQALR